MCFCCHSSALLLIWFLSSVLIKVVRVRPNDKDAKMKYQECNKIVKQKAFERAIASDETKKSVVDSLDIENMSVFAFLLE